MERRVSTLSFDPEEALAHLSECDPVLARLIAQAGPFTLAPEPLQSPFVALLRAIVYQQLSGKAAATIYGRVERLFGRGKPRPDKLLAIAVTDLRAAGMSQAKVLAARDLAEKTLDGTVPTLAKLSAMTDDEIVERLVQVRGIGRWSAEMLLMFRLGRPDVLPVADLGVRRGYMLTYRKRKLPEPKALLKHGESWRPFRSVASWYFWRACDLHSGKLQPTVKDEG